MSDTVRMSKTACVMEPWLQSPDSSFVHFALFSDDEERSILRMCAVRDMDWAEMGMPSTITVTVERGDMLNADPSEGAKK